MHTVCAECEESERERVPEDSAHLVESMICVQPHLYFSGDSGLPDFSKEFWEFENDDRGSEKYAVWISFRSRGARDTDLKEIGER